MVWSGLHPLPTSHRASPTPACTFLIAHASSHPHAVPLPSVKLGRSPTSSTRTPLLSSYIWCLWSVLLIVQSQSTLLSEHFPVTSGLDHKVNETETTSQVGKAWSMVLKDSMASLPSPFINHLPHFRTFLSF